MAANGDLDLARAQRSYIYGNTLRERCSGVGNEWLIGIRRRQFTGSAIAEKVVERSLNILLYGIRAAVAQIGMLSICLDDIDTVLLGLLRGRQHAGVSFEMRVF